MVDTRPPLVLVDGSSYLYRAFHALPPLLSSKGQPTGAIKGVISMLRRLVKDYPDSPVVVVFDAKGKTFRDDIYPAYKAQRPPMPDDLRAQVQPLHDIIRAMGLPLLVEEGVEADDVIGSYARQAAAQGRQVFVSTGDKDMAQLVGAHITLVNTMTDTVLDEQGVRDKFGVPPALIIDLLALMGDKVDNIPGVAGVGEKTALALLQGIGGLDDIYTQLEKVAELPVRGAKQLATRLEAGREEAYLSYRLATIRTDLELTPAVDALANHQAERERLLAYFTELEFKSWVDELASREAAPAVPRQEQARDYQLVLTEEALAVWMERLRTATLFAFDTETTSLDYIAARVVGVSFAVQAGEGAYVPFGHDYLDAPAQLCEAQVLGALKPLLEDPARLKVGQNLKYDRSVLANHGITLRGIAHDTMLQSYVLNSSIGRHDMDTLALRHLGLSTIHFEDIAGKGAKQLTFNQIDLAQAGPYAAEDADITLRLHETLWPQLQQVPGLKAVYETIEVPLLTVLSRMERHGALISRPLLEQQSIELGERLIVLERQAFELAGEEFNLSSPKQLGAILFDKLQLPVLKKTPTGAASTAEEVLADLAHDYPLPAVIMEYRGLAKLKSTYTDKLPAMISPVTGRVHTSYHQAVTATGRLSSTDPNLQNIPIRTAEGRRIRRAFIAPPGRLIVAADYSQIELRIMAHLSGDAGLRSAFAQGLDVHQATAAEVFGIALEQVSADQRRSAKAINFGLIYGMSAFGLARQLQTGRHEAQAYIDRYFERYPGVRQYMDATRAQAAERGYVETLFGRRLYLPDIRSRNGAQRQAAERTAINAPMQGTAADIIKRAMLAIDTWLAESTTGAQMILQVHDELVFEVPEDQLGPFVDTVAGQMAGAAELAVPLVVDVGSGKNWDEAH